jgi:23S rRNA pseudouridine2605 synthase/23S rRNA pseudouridine2604 synthase
LTHPSFDHEKEYEVEAADPIPDASLQILRSGVILDGIKTRKAAVKRISDRKFRIVLKEGKKRQIRRMVEMVGGKVVGLHRIRVAGLRLGDLAPSKWRYLSDAEIETINQ